MKMHDELINNQFSHNAYEYLKSNNHKTGEDLESIKKYLGNKNTKTLLDLGCGAGHVSYTLATLFESIVAYDMSQNMLDIVSSEFQTRKIKNAITVKGKVDKLPFENGSFSVIVSRYSAHHWFDMDGALKEIHRVLQDDGILIFSDISTFERSLVDTFLQSIEMIRDNSHVRDYSKKEWINYLKKHQFNIDKIELGNLSIVLDEWLERTKPIELYKNTVINLLSNASKEVKTYLKIDNKNNFIFPTILIFSKKMANPS